MNTLSHLSFENRFARLPETFYQRVSPTPLANAYMISFSPLAAELMGIAASEFNSAEAVAYFSGAKAFACAEPLAMLYSGHQFGRYVPQLGDGRAILLGGVKNPAGEVWEWQLKGAGLTAFSRDGDGRAVLRSSIREYLCSEAMAALGIPTTRALCLIGSDEEVYREQIETGAMVLRMAPSHLRFGSFEVFFYRDQHHALKQLADYVLQHHYPELLQAERPYLAFLQEVVKRTARLIAQWQLVGFAHGVMNTDNMSVLGLTLDYGPFGFMDAYEPGFICNHSDHHGRYAFEQQPNIGLWNLTCFAQALLPLLHANDGEAAAAQAREALALYEPELVKTYARGMRAKLGLLQAHESDQALSAELLQLMADNRADYTQVFRALSDLKQEPISQARVSDLFTDRAAFEHWAEKYRLRLHQENSQDQPRQALMRQTNPKYILRNYLAQQAIEKAQAKDFSEIERLLAVLSQPFAEQPDRQVYAAEPPDWSQHLSVSCSS